MLISENAAKIPTVTNTPGEDVGLLIERGERLRERIERLDGLSTAKAARLAGVSRNTAYAAYKGEALPEKVLALEHAVDDYEAHPEDRDELPHAVQSTEAGLIEIELDDVYGIGRIVVRGAESDELVEMIGKIVRRIRDAGSDEGI